MAPPITPSPHRFLSGGQGKTHQQTRDETETKVSHSFPVIASKSSGTKSSTQRSFQFATTPRFTSRQTYDVTQATPSPKSKRDTVEDFANDAASARSRASFSPLLRHQSGNHLSREQIDGAIAENAPVCNKDLGDDLDLRAVKRRKVPLPPTWSDGTPVTSNASLSGKPITREEKTEATSSVSTLPSRRHDPIIPSSSQATNEEDQMPTPAANSPLSGRRSAPRFNFSRSLDTGERVANASNNLQRVVGTAPFILPPAASDEQNELFQDIANANLALLFSPQKHRKYQYAPGGVAATVRDWILEASARIMGEQVVVSFRILEIQAGERGSRLVTGVDRLGEEHDCLLLGESQDTSGLQLAVGAVVVVLEPSWLIELHGSWHVAVRWKMVDEDHG